MLINFSMTSRTEMPKIIRFGRHACMCAGVQLIEELVRNPRAHVAAWKLSDDDVRPTIQAALLQVRQLAVENIVLMTSRNLTDILLDVVASSCYALVTILEFDFDSTGVRLFVRGH